MRHYTIGYGGRRPDELVELLRPLDIRTVVDVRLRPDRSSMGSFALARTPDKGIAALVTSAGHAYVSLPELGNVFMDLADWRERYRRLLESSGDLLFERLFDTPGPWCLLCAEKRAANCHRETIADALASRGHVVEHVE
jgi:uncharacterized protein (DUF488 family)